MSQSTLPIIPGPAIERRRAVTVELGTRQLPARMRLGGLRSSLGLLAPEHDRLRRALMVPLALVSRLLRR